MITAEELITKSEKALSSSKLLLQAGDTDGACNRAYYAMFDAARAALHYAGKEEVAITTKTHSGMITAFSLHLVKSGTLDVELGRSLNKVEDIRLMADYMGASVTSNKAEWAVQQATIFVQSIKKQFQ